MKDDKWRIWVIIALLLVLAQMGLIGLARFLLTQGMI
jgi:Na+/H+ antiporter NhaB